MGSRITEETLRGRGFAGLESLVSNLDDVIAQCSKHLRGHPDQKPQAQPEVDAQRSQRSSAGTKPVEQSPQPGGSTSGTGKVWVLVVGFLIFVWWITAEKPGSQPPQAESIRPASSIGGDVSNAPLPAMTQPPVGTNHVHSVSEIRWCLAEEIKVDALRNLARSNAEIDRFNQLVYGYNSRCGSFQYRTDALERARRDIELHRSAIIASAHGAIGITDRTQKVSTQPSQLIMDIQRLLNILGYARIEIDGIYGEKTKAAIVEFQLDRGFTPDGQVSLQLLESLEDELGTGR